MTRWDAEVLVVGAGPAGATTAALLAQAGRDVLLIDRASFPRDKPCGEYLDPGVVDALDRLGMLERVLASGPARLSGMDLVTGRNRHAIRYRGAEGPPGSRIALGVRRETFDAIVLQHARDSGVRVALNGRVTGAIREGERVVGARVRADSGDDRPIRAPVTVGADGRMSVVARSLGLERWVRWPRRLGLVRRFAVPDPPSCGQMLVGPHAYCGLAPVGGGIVTAGLVAPLGAKEPGESTDGFFQRQLHEISGVEELLHDARPLDKILGAAPLARAVEAAAGQGYLLVGDAAGFLDPFTGEGIYRSLRGAELAADAAARALERWDAFPVGYEQARRREFGSKERLCLLIQAFLRSPRAFDYALGRLNARPETAQLLSDVLGDYRPARQALQPWYLAKLLRPGLAA